MLELLIGEEGAENLMVSAYKYICYWNRGQYIYRLIYGLISCYMTSGLEHARMLVMDVDNLDHSATLSDRFLSKQLP